MALIITQGIGNTMQTKIATRLRLLFQIQIFCLIPLLGHGLTTAQDNGIPRFPAPQTNGDTSKSTSEFNINDLRPGTTNSQQRSQPAFEPIQFPNRAMSNSNNANSILQKQPPQFPAMEPIRGNSPKTSPQEFKLPSLGQQPNRMNLAQPARDIPTVSPESFRSSDISLPGEIRTVSANLQDDGRNSAKGTQPLGPRSQTQTVQQGDFKLPQQPGRNPSPANNGAANSSLPTFNQQPRTQFPNNQQPRTQFPSNSQASNPAAQTNSPLTLESAPVRQQPVRQPTLNVNSGMGNPNPTINNQRFANGASNPNRNLQSGQTPATNRSTSLAKNLMNQFSVNATTRAIPGEPVAMKQMLQLTSPQNRTAMVNQYWATYQAWCEMVCCAQHLDALGQVVLPNNPAEKSLMDTAKSIARNELLSAEIQLTKAQSRLQRFIPNSQNDLVLPIPSDQPLISGYTTHIDYYASRRVIPNDVRNIATTLPKMLMLINQQAQTAESSKSSMDQIRSFVQGGRAPITEALQATQMWSDANKHLVRSVVDYNRSIANYSLNVMGPNKSIDQLAIALVGKPRTQSIPSLSPTVRQANLPAELQPRRTTTPNVNFGSGTNGQTNPPVRQSFGNPNANFNGNVGPRANVNPSNNSTFQSVPNTTFRNN